ncbi:uncharacterized protein PV07_11550 [Cladophialophora immunda]|uniref:Uncharacterized protein n=1 Tax=Cladophialophora immunda TaxID=569365 RepID=A0A0D2AEL8_9EURO|nr:uncharacterized protein PV07_11550 [Cladophialophora immunda]KIW23342.1 hypothetical protein PV07_11550 [Cladophialophora immunda]OQV07025.1 hypothetical protein CLAIMM_11518 [Cladophialophora immunda]
MSPPLRDNVSRNKAPSILGRALFVGLRTADVFWQYSLLSRGLGLRFLQALGARTVDAGDVTGPSHALGLKPYYQLVLLLALGSSVKQNVHMLCVSEQELPAGSAFGISLFNTIFNSVNTILSLWAVTSQSPASSNYTDLLYSPVSVGAGLYAIGLLVEAVSEFQRKSFKQDPANRGKPYAGGLFSLATNINYGAYTIWRSAYALIAGGLGWSVVTFTFFFRDFATRGVPVLEDYLTSRYGETYKDVQRRVKYKLIPGIY